MSYFKRITFKGIAPAVSPRLLSDDFAQTAENIDFESGRLTPIKEDLDIGDDFNASSRSSVFIYRYRTTDGGSGTTAKKLEWNDDYVKAVHSPLATDDDEYERAYWTGEGDYPKMAPKSTIISGSTGYPAAHYRLGVPAGASAITTSKSGTASETQEPDTVSYVVTFVSAYGEEGPPNNASTTITKTDPETVTLTIPAFSGSNNNLTKKRVYRSNTGSTSTNFQFLAELSSTGWTTPDGTYTAYSGSYGINSIPDTVDSTALGEVLPSLTWVGPPDDTTASYPYGPLENLISVGNGILAGHSGNRLCFSEAYLPHAWPVQYRLTIDASIVGLGATANGVVVLTQGSPFFVTGTDPSAMSAIQVDLMQACINKHSIVDMGEYVLYASPDGLVAVSGTEGEVVTKNVITALQWNTDFKPSIIKAFLHEGTYIAFWKSGSDYGGWIYDPRATENQFSTLTSDVEIRGGTTDTNTGDVYLIVANTAMKFRGATTNKTAKWKSKKHLSDMPVSLGWVSVHAVSWPTLPDPAPTGSALTTWIEANAIKITVYGDGATISVYYIWKEIDDNDLTSYAMRNGSTDTTLREPIMRLPATVAQEWEVEVETKYEVNEVCLAQSMDELKGT